MNQLSYKVDDFKLRKEGIALKSSISKDIQETLGLFNNINNK